MKSSQAPCRESSNGLHEWARRRDGQWCVWCECVQYGDFAALTPAERRKLVEAPFGQFRVIGGRTHGGSFVAYQGLPTKGRRGLSSKHLDDEQAYWHEDD
jgi:hypothetical protein